MSPTLSAVLSYSITYEIVTPESAEQGDVEERGYVVEGTEIPLPDDFSGARAAQWCEEMCVETVLGPDDLDDLNPVQAMARILIRAGATEPSSQPAGHGTWYSTQPYENYQTGARTTQSYHLRGFTPEQEVRIGRLMTSAFYRMGL